MPEDVHVKYLSIHLDEQGQKVIASFTPEGDTDAITPEECMQAIHAAGFGGCSIHHQSLGDATAKYNSGEAFEIIVGEALDGKFSIRIDANLMAAYLNCTLPVGGAPVHMQSILQEVEHRGITATLDLKAIDKALGEGSDNMLIARGKPPVAGVNGKFESLIPSMKERSPRLDENGLADFRDLGEIVTVQAGSALMRLILPTEGEPGETVTGEIIPAKAGKEVEFATNLTGAILDPKDLNTLIAAVSGCPAVLKNGVSVDPVFVVKNVDLRTGNISFMGTVQVSGDVGANMTIKASGDIHIDGTVESAILEAGGDIVIKGGVLGGSELHVHSDTKAHAAIKCNGSFTARFVQNAHISAGNGIFIQDLAMLSELTAGHQIIVGEKGGRKGDIIGGIARATMLVKAQNIGSSAYVKTVVIAGADKLLHERHNTIIKAYEDSMRKFADIIKLLEVARLSPGRVPPETVKSAQATRAALNDEIETLREDEAELKKEMDAATRAQVAVEKHVFGGTEVHIGLKRYNTAGDKEGGFFHIDDKGELVFV